VAVEVAEIYAAVIPGPAAHLEAGVFEMGAHGFIRSRVDVEGKVIDILNAITEDCARNARFSTDRCKAVYGELSR